MLQKILIIIIIFFGVFLHTGLSLAQFEESDMVGVHEVALQIYDACPPSTCLVIGLGQSPTPFVADLSTAAKNYVWNMPLSNFKYHDPDGSVSKKQLSESERSKLFAHLKTFLPPAHFRRGKKLLMVDYAESGKSLLSAQRYFQDYLNEEDPDPKSRPRVESAAITVPKKYLPNLTQRRPNFLFMIKEKRLAYKLDEASFDQESEYGSFYVKGGYTVPKERKSSKAYLELVEKIQKLRVQLKLKPFLDRSRQESLEIKTEMASCSSSSSSGQTSSSLEKKETTMLDTILAKIRAWGRK